MVATYYCKTDIDEAMVISFLEVQNRILESTYKNVGTQKIQHKAVKIRS